MLETLRIENYALIDEVEVEFRPGFNVLTGETGAGKSIVVGALNLVLGARAASGTVRKGAKNARVEALFRLPSPSPRLAALLDEHGIELEEGTLLLARTVSREGRSRAYAGGALTPIAVLSAIGDELVDLHGQHEHQSLLKPERQLELLDAFGHGEDAARAVSAQVAELRRLEHEIAALERDDRDRLRQMEFLRFEVNEIDAAGLVAGEEEKLETRLNRITHAERIFGLAGQACAVLYENEASSAIDAIDAGARALDELAEIDAGFRPLANELAEARGKVEAVASELRGHTQAIEFDPAELEELNQRKVELAALKRKYGGSVDEMLAYRDKAAQELANYEARDERLETWRQDAAARAGKAQKEAEKLAKKRRNAARKLDKEVCAALQGLGMKGARFESRLERIELCANGLDRVIFLIAANAGEDLKPLRQVASGGEVSRIMLALKAVFADADRIPSLIFDEIDAGVGGGVARMVAGRLGELAQSHQVVCVTHIAQIAATAGTHFTVSKTTGGKRTLTQVCAVEDAAREEELARLLDGSLSEVSLEHARALLAGASDT